MVDFKKLRESKTQSTVIEPIDIFRRLPKPPGINDLYTSQAQALEAWFSRRNERDLVIKLHTGGGKTLVGLLIAQSILNEHCEPVIYLSPTVQLVQQTLEKAKEYSIPAVAYEKGTDFPDEFLAGKSVLICTYQALFNGRSRFGVRGIKQAHMAAAIILDDAHVAFSAMRDTFTLRVDKDSQQENYTYLTNLFRNDFQMFGKLGTFDDLVSGADHGILEVPYWSWQAKSTEIREFLRRKSESYQFVWSFIRDNFDYCHCLISRKAFVITPISPLVDMIPTFADCPRRVFMSATISDDSAIVRTFDANPDSIAKPITSNSLAGVSERMILAPELMPFSSDDVPQMLRELAKEMANQQKVGTVILVPSNASAKLWEDVAIFSDSTEKVAAHVKELQEGKSHGPFVFANRYDGIDLPGSACRLLILSELPIGSSEYDQYRANTFIGGSELSSALAQRIEQGMGRGARGGADYCVVIVTGKNLTAWLGREGHLKFLTKSTHAQFEMGVEISKSVADKKDLHETIMRCLERDKDWIEYHAETLAELTEATQEDNNFLTQAAVERKAFQLMRDGYLEKAIAKLEKHWQEAVELDQKSRGWLKQLAARAAYYWGETDKAQQLQQQAYADNNNLLRPQVIPPYVPLTIPGKQAEAIVERFAQYKPHRRAYIAWIDQQVSHLVPEASASQFEQALENLGYMLGFCTHRPEKLYRKGPDILWLLNDNVGLVIEAKSRKHQNNVLTKNEHGQLLNAEQWFKKEYPNHSCIRVSVHPNIGATKNTVTNDSKALTLEKLNQLITDARTLLVELCESVVSEDELVVRCEQLLADSTLRPQSLIEQYLVPFEEME
ncbi:DEAD/DEAH box helicase [Coleofasciculus sp. FACHB-SPT9]|uniref:DEAD/DEAH box helicase n=1 Tax=Cyanophyceae TaxID=3028117 RepID=UPI001688BE24|nr:DEAD/DEAH box helicase [Coleofasciculus sp. FACHB-SPT9]MBD1891754.1 DEAD/DEAH box helicase family protein [Coleofasciculus sp. FACHB-SPT9]